MRNRRGEPNLRVRLLAGLVALLLLGPVIALAVFRAAAHMLSLAL
jgi:multisubunit Na+/H+ antiporter MnhG subunit